MLDNQLIALIISTIIGQEAIAGIPGTPIKQAFQPTQQGANTQPTAYLHKIHDKRYGFRRSEDIWDPVNKIMGHEETQQYETMFQISTLSTQDPANVSQYTASDILNLIAYILQSATTIVILQSNSVGIERISDVRNPYFKDDRDRFEASPSMDFTLTHKQIITSTVPILTKTELVIKEI